jgi:predicted ATP-grasp superfamily ATP-dependent carboligase
VVRTDDHTIAQSSRYAEARSTWPEGEDDRVKFLLELASRETLDGWILIPTHDEEAAMIARHRDELATRYRVTTPTWDMLCRAYDKRRTHAFADHLGLAQPWTLFPASADDLAEAESRLPVVIKPAYKADANPLTAAKAWRVDDLAALERRWLEASRLMDPRILMIQELVPGDGDAQLSFGALCADGTVLAEITAQRTRQYPMDFGRASSFVETIVDQSVVRDARRLLEAMRFTGLVEVEFKRDARTGANLLLDVNPRAWGWQSLCGRAGVDFPYLLWLHARGRRVPTVTPRAGVRWVRLATDVMAAAGEIRAGRLTVRDYLASVRRPIEFSVFVADDPLPALYGPVAGAHLIVRRLLEGRPV